MLTFNEFYIHDGKLVIDVSIQRNLDDNSLDYFENVYFKDLKIYTQDSYTDSLDIYHDEILNAYSYSIADEEGQVQDFQITVPLKSIAAKDVYNSILFVCLTTTGTPHEDVPCEYDRNVWVRPILSFENAYKQFLEKVGDIYSSGCEVSKDLLSYMLAYMSLRVALEGCDYDLALELFSFMQDSNVVGTTKKCGCHG